MLISALAHEDIEDLIQRYPPPREQRDGRILRLIPASAILPEVEEFLIRSKMSMTAFSLASVGSVNIVQHLRRGRPITDYRYALLKHFMATNAK